jgi:hypothetical protein
MTYAAQPFPPGLKSKHLFWGLLFLKLYNSKPVNCLVADCDEKTFRKWVWAILEALAPLEPYVVRANQKCPISAASVISHFLFLVLRRFHLITDSRMM